ncbi:MAG: hypothetical protein FWE12_01120 [Oscillospiraceae bacterium]|nr:hypothetical protein [Oscillospiraceae bacterium]
MYNRYIGNTGKFYRVEEMQESRPEPTPLPPEPPLSQWIPTPPPPPLPEMEAIWTSPEPPPLPPPPSSSVFSDLGAKFDLGAMLNMPGSIRGSLRDKLPESIDLGDILLVIVLIYLFLEGDDDDMLIILGVLLFTWIIWPWFQKDE